MPLLPYQRTRAIDEIRLNMSLREPQVRSLEVVSSILSYCPNPFGSMGSDEVVYAAKQVCPAWTFAQDHIDLTFDLATGVGKSRLLAAIMALLAQTEGCRDFLILAPSSEVLRKFRREFISSSKDFLLQGVRLPAPVKVITMENVDTIERGLIDGDGSLQPVNVFVLSPQLFVQANRIDQPLPFFGLSLRDYLKTRDNLVVFADEAHHIGGTRRGDGRRTWSDELESLEPHAVFRFTATPPEDVDIGYSYPLKRALRDGLYTKGVRITVDTRAGDEEDGAREFELAQIRLALSFRETKQTALDKFRRRFPGGPANAVAMLCCTNIKHARATFNLLLEQFDFDEKEVLLYTSRDSNIEQLLAIQDDTSPTKVVVQVRALDEGWDVSNIWVIAPLRVTESYRNAIQVLGRGLRLPFGKRLKHSDLDVLEIVAFGSETFASINKQVRADFGPDSDVIVVEVGQGGELPFLDVDDDFLEDTEEVDPKDRGGQIRSCALRPMSLLIPQVSMVAPVLPGDFEVSTPEGIRRALRTVEVGSLEVDTVSAPPISQEEFVAAVVYEVIGDSGFLSYPVHVTLIAGIAQSVIVAEGCLDGRTSLDPHSLAITLTELIQSETNHLEPEYLAGPGWAGVAVVDRDIRIREGASPKAQERHAWTNDDRRMPFDGWSKCAHDCAIFDVEPEFALARKIDSMAGVVAWLRNDPPIFQIQVPARPGFNFRPDFLVLFEREGRYGIAVVEIKGRHLLSKESQAQVKMNDAYRWADAVNSFIDDLGEAGLGNAVSIGFVRDDRVAEVFSLEDLMNEIVRPRSEV